MKCVKSLSRKKINLVLAGGVFANVKLNQKIAEFKNVNNYMFSQYGRWWSLCGGAQLAYFEKTGKIPKNSINVSSGQLF